MNNPQARGKKSFSIGVISLGCARNTVDSESLLAGLLSRGHRYAAVSAADVVIVNTCGFIEAAKKESIAVIHELARLKKQGKIQWLVVAGCLAQRYAEELRQGFPEVDAFVGALSLKKESRQAALSLTPAYFSYLKICESCFNHCHFCAIPKIKGKFASRSLAAILEDVRRLDGQGVRELNIVGQDITAYGLDLFQEKRLAFLLKEMLRVVRHIGWIRLLYAYPSHITDELLDVMASSPVICKYIDMPLQHVNDRVLAAMGRNMTRLSIEKLIVNIRRRIPGVSLRTTFIVGFPGETDKEFRELLTFMKDFPFERAGAFTYSREEGTRAYALGDPVSASIKQARYRKLMTVQEAVAGTLQERLIGRTLKVLVDGDGTGRSEFDAPEVDGCVHWTSRQKDTAIASRALNPGQFVEVRITGAAGYDLQGVVV